MSDSYASLPNPKRRVTQSSSLSGQKSLEDLTEAVVPVTQTHSVKANVHVPAAGVHIRNGHDKTFQNGAAVIANGVTQNGHISQNGHVPNGNISQPSKGSFAWNNNSPTKPSAHVHPHHLNDHLVFDSSRL